MMQVRTASLLAKPNGANVLARPSGGAPWPKKKEQFLRQHHDYSGGDASKVGFVYAKLKNIVMNYQVRPGERLHAHAFAERLRVSATPVREVLIKLHIEQFIALVPNRGFYSKALDVKEQVALHELAGLIVEHAIRHNIDGFEPPDFAGTDGPIANDSDVPADPALVQALRSERLYQHIAALSGNREMINFMQSFCDRTHCLRRLELEDTENMQALGADLDGMVAALSCRNAESATAIVARVFEDNRRRLPGLVKEGNSRALAANFP